MIRTPAIELLFALTALVLDQIAVLGGVAVMVEPSTILSSIAIGLLLARCNDERHRKRRRSKPPAKT
ncbi:MAG TPA: hypothetical protein VGX26_10185 [Solirubrobacteraceae bacterium]|nr:hypothetical protein [Solirubrobacteraceae bacterium]